MLVPSFHKRLFSKSYAFISFIQFGRIHELHTVFTLYAQTYSWRIDLLLTK
ncbi:uncharacterized protein DS421_13g416910 [Arachis hypogaea]|nr:uncharacterized protein DS421_13g416910 [Arachis hypogaea]